MNAPAIDYSRYQTLAITRRGVNDAVIDIQMRGAPLVRSAIRSAITSRPIMA